MILKSRVFSLAFLLAIAVMTPGVLKAQEPMNEVPLGTTSTGSKTGGASSLENSIESIDGTSGTTAAPSSGPEAVAF
ncbi:MAG TPA: hypothetical protein VFY61_18740, partial [Pyrinomonadaceae bacterium]|nr:hypothetical protein [Pyrinomonadaceae bacterium]